MWRTVDDVPAEAADVQPGPFLLASFEGLPAAHAQQNLDRNIFRDPVRSEPAHGLNEINLKVATVKSVTHPSH